ncbi:allophanate hydrolase-related protein [Eleftheria terrae]|uniref:allophanate hydrolase-related protein n=1 Tax=Eleftheria terrae TaxID=1597781 RepID=UPI00263B9FEF|nr:amidase family protein [Eleftheria terrae]WKB51169.1 amidase family protein [Eleftheria terrae]
MIALPRTIDEWLAAYRSGALHPRDALPRLCHQAGQDDPGWAERCDPRHLAAQLQALQARDAAALPLYGVPFAVQDGVEAQAVAASAVDRPGASVVRRLVDAGAVLLGRIRRGTEDGLPDCPDCAPAAVIEGASCALAVARGQVAFAVGAGARGGSAVAAGFCNVVGCQPSAPRGALHGAQDGAAQAGIDLHGPCVFALSVRDTARVLRVIEAPADDPWPLPLRDTACGLPSPLRVGVPSPGQAGRCDGAYAAAFERALVDLRDLGAEVGLLDVRQREAARHGDAPPGTGAAAAAPTRRRGRTATVAALALPPGRDPLWPSFDLVMLPCTAHLPAWPEGPDAVWQERPDALAGRPMLTVPAGFVAGGRPFGVCFVGPAGSDLALAQLGSRWQAALGLPLGAGLGRIELDALCLPPAPWPEPVLTLAVVGPYGSGMPLHHRLAERRCRPLHIARTAPCYRLYALHGGQPAHAGLARAAAGAPIEVELYEMPQSEVGAFLASIEAPLGLGPVELEDGRAVQGLLVDPPAAGTAEDITAWGGWPAFLRQRRVPSRRRVA